MCMHVICVCARTRGGHKTFLSFIKNSGSCWDQSALSLIPSISWSMPYTGTSPERSTQQGTANASEVSVTSAAPSVAVICMRECSTFQLYILLSRNFIFKCMSLCPEPYVETCPPSFSQKDFMV